MSLILTDIKVSALRANPRNPRKRFEGRAFDELVESIKKRGIQSPITIRMVDGKAEIVFGHRRVEAIKKISPSSVIPAVLAEMTDDEAFDSLVIENLQRADLTQFEESMMFFEYINGSDDREERIKDLAERTGLKDSYIRKRYAVISVLPKYIKDAWEKGAILFGHVEQLLRVEDKSIRKDIFEYQVMGGNSVEYVRSFVNRLHVNLAKAPFPLDDCRTCVKNTQVQGDLFDIATPEAQCMNKACFISKTKLFLGESWEATEYRKDNKTNGPVFREDIDEDKFMSFDHGDEKPFKKCFSCEKFVTVFDEDLDQARRRACLDKPCYKSLAKEVEKKAIQKANEEAGLPSSPEGEVHVFSGDTPRVAWHGEAFREEFYAETIPSAMLALEPGSMEGIRIAILLFMRLNTEAKKSVGYMLGLLDEDESKRSWEDIKALGEASVFGKIATLSEDQLRSLFIGVVTSVLMGKDIESATSTRWMVGEHLGLDIEKQYVPTEFFFGKKTKNEVLALGDHFGWWMDKNMAEYGAIKKIDDWKKAKKSELVDALLNSGIDMTGDTVPEIIEHREVITLREKPKPKAKAKAKAKKKAEPKEATDLETGDVVESPNGNGIPTL